MFLGIGLFAVAAASAVACGQLPQNMAKPHLIFAMVDDLGGYLPLGILEPVASVACSSRGPLTTVSGGGIQVGTGSGSTVTMMK